MVERAYEEFIRWVSGVEEAIIRSFGKFIEDVESEIDPEGRVFVYVEYKDDIPKEMLLALIDYLLKDCGLSLVTIYPRYNYMIFSITATIRVKDVTQGLFEGGEKNGWTN